MVHLQETMIFRTKYTKVNHILFCDGIKEPLHLFEIHSQQAKFYFLFNILLLGK